MGDYPSAQKLRIQWPDGEWSGFDNVSVNQHVTVMRDLLCAISTIFDEAEGAATVFVD